MSWLWLAIELALELFASWTLAAHACLGFGWPAYLAWPLFAAAFVGCLFVSRGRLSRAVRDGADGAGEAGFALAVLALGAIFGGVSLVLLTPSGDDFNFFHRALWQLDHLFQPIAPGDTAFNVEGLAAISPLHTLTTWELGVAMSASALGLEPLGVYHNGTVVVVNLLLAAIFALWLRELRFGAAAALLGTLVAFGFCLVDDPHVRSYGIAYRMLWVGKMVQWLLFFPVALLLALRYLRAPSLHSLWHPLLCGVAAVGLSGTGVFLLPALFGLASLAGLVFQRLDLPHLIRCGSLNFGSLYCLIIAGLVATGTLRQPDDVRAWTDSFPAEWTQNLMLVFGTPAGAVRAAALGLLVPALVLEGRGRRFLVAFALLLLVTFANPLTAPLWMDVVMPGSFWRVALLVPLPVLCGLAVAAAFAGVPSRGLAVCVATAALALVLLARFSTAPAERFMPHTRAFKAPLELRFAPAELRFVRAAASELGGRNLLASPGIATTAALLVPSLRLEAARLQDTRHVFANAGRPEEGERRLQAWDWTGRCEQWMSGARAARLSLEAGVDALILRDCGADTRNEGDRQRLLRRDSKAWREVVRADGYVLYLAR